jgi:hypothetical protein
MNSSSTMHKNPIIKSLKHTFFLFQYILHIHPNVPIYHCFQYRETELANIEIYLENIILNKQLQLKYALFDTPQAN